MTHNQATNTIPVDGDRSLFDRIARKYHVDYAFHKTGPGKYLLLFKSGQADAITAAFAEYTKLTVKRARDKRPPIREQLARAAEQAQRDQARQPNERRRVREVTHGDR